MEHAKEILQRPMSGPAETPQPSQAFLDALQANLALFGEIYRQELTPLAVVAYREALKDLSVKALNVGFELALKNCKFIPNPAEIRAYAAECPPPPATNGCEVCRGTGWRVVPRMDGLGDQARRCECSPRKAKT